jgi:hypothetical protein
MLEKFDAQKRQSEMAEKRKHSNETATHASLPSYVELRIP